MNQWFIFGLNGVGKSWFLKNKKCEDITKYKWNELGARYNRNMSETAY